MMKRIAKLMMVVCMTLGLNAGDPGPFEIDFYDAGVPPWLDRGKVLHELESQVVWLGITSHSEIEGRYVSRVFKNSPAEEAGIRVGDIIEENSWNAIYDGKHPNDSIVLTIVRNKKQISKKVSLSGRDPLINMLMDIEGDGHHSGNPHRNIHQLSKENKQKVYKNAFLKNKAFNCNHAHEKLFIKMFPNSDFRGGGAQVVVIRGSHRVMFINIGMRYENIGKHTVCVNSVLYDGKNLTNKNVTKLFWKLFDSQVKFWYEHP